MVGRRSDKTIEIRREVLHRAAKKKNLYREEDQPYTAVDNVSDCMEEDTQTGSKAAMTEAAQQLQLERALVTLRTTHSTRLAEFRKRANKNYNRSVVTKAFNEPLTEGSIYRVKDIIPIHTHRRMEQIWTLEEIDSKRVSMIRAPKSLLKYSKDPYGTLSRGIIPILKCLNFVYKGYIRTPRTKKRYRFSAVKAQVGVRQLFEAVTYFTNVLKADVW